MLPGLREHEENDGWCEKGQGTPCCQHDEKVMIHSIISF